MALVLSEDGTLRTYFYFVNSAHNLQGLLVQQTELGNSLLRDSLLGP